MGKCRRIPKSLSYIKEEHRRAGGGEGVRRGESGTAKTKKQTCVIRVRVGCGGG